MHILNLNYKNILILKKIEFGYFRVQSPLKFEKIDNTCRTVLRYLNNMEFYIAADMTTLVVIP